MSNIAIYNGSSTFVSGSSTPFGFYDYDSTFRTDAVNVSQWCAQRLGYPLVEVELQTGSFFTAFEEAVTTYGNEVYQWKVRENYLNLEGSTTGSNLNNQLVTPNLGNIIRISETYASEAGAGGETTWHTGSFSLVNGIQDYNIESALSNDYDFRMFLSDNTNITYEIGVGKINSVDLSQLFVFSLTDSPNGDITNNLTDGKEYFLIAKFNNSNKTQTFTYQINQ